MSAPWSALICASVGHCVNILSTIDFEHHHRHHYHQLHYGPLWARLSSRRFLHKASVHCVRFLIPYSHSLSSFLHHPVRKLTHRNRLLYNYIYIFIDTSCPCMIKYFPLWVNEKFHFPRNVFGSGPKIGMKKCSTWWKQVLDEVKMTRWGKNDSSRTSHKWC